MVVTTGSVVQRKRNPRAGAHNANQSDELTNRKSGNTEKQTKKGGGEEKEKKMNVFKRFGFILIDKSEHTIKKKKKAKGHGGGTVRKRSSSASTTPMIMDTKVHFALSKAHTTFPLKGDPITEGQKKVFHKFAVDLVKKGPMELSMEFTSKVKTYIGTPMKRDVFDANPTKNRYKDVVCNDITRVVIQDSAHDTHGDYIHANFVNGLTVPFILTQGPLERTVFDFWRMIIYTKTSFIVMLCETLEDGKPKCYQYWPDKAGETVTFQGITITCKSEEDKDEHVTKSTLLAKFGDREHCLKHLHTKSWPDKSVPNSQMSLLRMLHIVRSSPGPVCVHCSAGIGRTGTFVAVEACLQILIDEKDLDLIATIKALRNSRLGSVQVDVQYMTLVQILLNFGKDNGYWEDSDLDDRIELLTWNISQFVTTRGKIVEHPNAPSIPKKEKPTPEPAPKHAAPAADPLAEPPPPKPSKGNKDESEDDEPEKEKEHEKEKEKDKGEKHEKEEKEEKKEKGKDREKGKGKEKEQATMPVEMTMKEDKEPGGDKDTTQSPGTPQQQTLSVVGAPQATQALSVITTIAPPPAGGDKHGKTVMMVPVGGGSLDKIEKRGGGGNTCMIKPSIPYMAPGEGGNTGGGKAAKASKEKVVGNGTSNTNNNHHKRPAMIDPSTYL